MAPLLEQKVVWGIIEGYDAKPPTPATDATVTEIREFEEWMNLHRVANSTILLGMEPRLQNKYTGVKDAEEPWEKLATTYRTKLQLTTDIGLVCGWKVHGAHLASGSSSFGIRSTESRRSER